MVPLLVKTQLDRGMPQEMLVRSATQYVEDTDIHLGQRRGWDQPGVLRTAFSCCWCWSAVWMEGDRAEGLCLHQRRG